MHRTDGDGFDAGNLFKETPLPPTQVDSTWLNAVQEEIASLIVTAGIALVKGTNTQLLAALRVLFMDKATAGQVITGYKTFSASLIANGGVAVTGIGAALPAEVSRGDGSTSAVALRSNGSIDLDGSTNVAGTVAVRNKVTAGLCAKARANLTGGGGAGAAAVNGESVNLTSATKTVNWIECVMPQAMADINYDVFSQVYGSFRVTSAIINATTFRLSFYDAAGATIDPTAVAVRVGFVVFGAQ